MRTVPLPGELRALVDETIEATRLSPTDRHHVRDDLESHFADGLAAGVSAGTLAERFGDPAVTATLIRRAYRGRRRRRIAPFLARAATVAALGYVLAVMRIHTAADSPAAVRLADHAASVLERASDAERELGTVAGIAAAYGVAAELRRQRDPWSETTSLILLAEVVDAAHRTIPAAERGWLRDSIVALATVEGLHPRSDLIDSATAEIVAAVHGRTGRVGRHGRRLLVHSKGALVVPLRARVVEPLYFALSLSRREVQQTITASLGHRARLAMSAAQRIHLRITGAASTRTAAIASNIRAHPLHPPDPRVQRSERLLPQDGDRIPSANAASVIRPAATRFMTITTSGSG